MAASKPNREQRKDIAKRTLKILEDGYYLKPCPYSGDSERVDLNEFMETSLQSSRCYNETDLNQIRRGIPRSLLRPGEQTELVVARMTAISACRHLHKEFRNREDVQIGCLNFASAKNPCGGMKGGSMAQEESLGYCTTLYRSLTQFREEYYDVNRADPREGYYNDNLIISPSVAVIRDEGDFMSLLQKKDVFPVTVITCPAVNCNRVKGSKIKELASKEKVEEVMGRRIENVLRVASEHGIQVLILGAWGCGVFGNDPEMVARLFRDFLVGPSALYSSVFRKVIFAMGKGAEKNAAAFQKMILGA